MSSEGKCENLLISYYWKAHLNICWQALEEEKDGGKQLCYLPLLEELLLDTVTHSGQLSVEQAFYNFGNRLAELSRYINNLSLRFHDHIISTIWSTYVNLSIKISFYLLQTQWSIWMVHGSHTEVWGRYKWRNVFNYVRHRSI